MMMLRWNFWLMVILRRRSRNRMSRSRHILKRP